jgi:hypothetical protein
VAGGREGRGAWTVRHQRFAGRAGGEPSRRPTGGRARGARQKVRQAGVPRRLQRGVVPRGSSRRRAARREGCQTQGAAPSGHQQPFSPMCLRGGPQWVGSRWCWVGARAAGAAHGASGAAAGAKKAGAVWPARDARRAVAGRALQGQATERGRVREGGPLQNEGWGGGWEGVAQCAVCRVAPARRGARLGPRGHRAGGHGCGRARPAAGDGAPAWRATRRADGGARGGAVSALRRPPMAGLGLVLRCSQSWVAGRWPISGGRCLASPPVGEGLDKVPGGAGAGPGAAQRRGLAREQCLKCRGAPAPAPPRGRGGRPPARPAAPRRGRGRRHRRGQGRGAGGGQGKK